MKTVTRLLLAALVLLCGDVYANEVDTINKYIKAYMDGIVDGDELFKRLFTEIEDEKLIRIYLYEDLNNARDDAYLINLLRDGNNICAKTPEERAILNKSGISAEDTFISALCDAAVLLAKRNKEAISKSIKEANEQCRLVIEFCSNLQTGVPEATLLDVVARSNSDYMRNNAARRLVARKEYEDKKRVIEILKEITQSMKNDFYLMTDVKAVLVKLGINDTGISLDTAHEAELTRGEVKEENLKVRSVSNSGKGSKEQGADSSQKKTQDPQERERGKGATVVIVVGAVVAFTVIFLLVGLKPWNR